MSVGTLSTENTTYFVDSNDTTISVPSGLYEASTTGTFTVSGGGASFFVEGSKKEVCLPDGLSAVSGVGSLLPTSWGIASYDSASAGLSVIDAVKDGATLRGITSNLSRLSSTNGTNWTFDGTYSATAAAPTIVWTTTADAQGNGLFNLNFPAGAQAGDVVIVTVGSDAASPALPSGWTDIENLTANADSFGRTFYKVMTETVDTSVQITSLAEATAIVAIAVRGVFSGRGSLGITFNSQAFTTGVPDAPAVTTTGANALVIAIGRIDDNSVASSVTAPAGYSNLVVAEAAGLTGQTVMLATKVVATAGSENPGAFGISGGISDAGAQITIALQSAYFTGSVSHLELANNQYFSTGLDGAFLRSTNLTYWENASRVANPVIEPTFVSYDRDSRSTAGNAVVTRNANIVAGDLIIASLHSQNTGTIAAVSTGFTQIASASNNGRQLLLYKIATSSEPSTYSFSTTNNLLAEVLVYRNVDTAAISGNTNWVGPWFDQSSGNRNVTVPSALATGTGSRFLAFTYVQTTSTVGSTAAGWVNRTNVYAGTTGTLNTYERTALLASGAVGGGTELVSSGNTNVSYSSIGLALPGLPPKNSMAFGNNVYVYAGTGNSVFTSTNGVYFTQRTSPFSSNNSPIKVAFLNGKFWMGGTNGSLASSTNGVTWTLATTGITQNIVDIVYEESTLFAIGSEGIGVKSTNETTWTTVAAPTSATVASTPGVLWVSRSDNGNTDGPVSIGFGTGLRAGDTVFVYVTQEVTANSGFPFIPEVLSSGWECIKTLIRFGDSNFLSGQFVFRKVMGAVPDAGFVIGGTTYLTSSTTTVNTRTRSLSAIGIRGVDQSVAITYATDLYSASTASPNPNTVVPAAANSVIVGFAGSRTQTTVTYPAGYIGNIPASTNSYNFIAYQVVSGTAAVGPTTGFTFATAGYWTFGVMAIPLTGSPTAASSSATTTELSYRAPYFMTFNSAGSITEALTTDSAFVGVSSNLVTGIRKVLELGRRLVALGADGKFYTSGNAVETLTLKKTGEVVKV